MIVVLICALMLILLALITTAAMFIDWKNRIIARYGENRERLSAISWLDFERFTDYLLHLEGYHVTQRGGAEPDGGVDLIAIKDSQSFVIQCKHWREKPVGVAELRQLLGSMTCEGIASGILITTGYFSQPALKLANQLQSKFSGNHIRLIDGDEICRMLSQRNHEPDVESIVQESLLKITALIMQSIDREKDIIQIKRCPACQKRMRLAHNSKNGDYFWSCPTWKICKPGARPLSDVEREVLVSGTTLDA